MTPEAKLRALGRAIAEGQDRLWDARSVTAQARERVLERAPTRGVGVRRGWRRASMGAAVAVAAGVALAVALWRTPEPLRFTVGTRTGVVGDWVRAPRDREVPLQFSDGSTVDLRRETIGCVTAVKPNGAHVVVERGGVRVSVIPREGAEWALTVGPFEVRVTGTRFDVSWDAGRAIFMLALHEGSVSVSGPRVGRERRVEAGETLRVSLEDDQFDLVGHASHGDAAVRPVADAEAHGESEPALSQKERSMPNHAAPAPREPGPSASAWNELARRGRYREALAAARDVGIESILRSSAPREVLELGDAARYAGEASLAGELYNAVRSRAPGTREAALAAFALGRLAFDQQTRYADAAMWFATYLREEPSGPLRREAHGRLLEARDRAGDREGARRTAEAYLERYPEGPHAPLARSLLGPERGL